jgi:Exostosin family
VLCAGAAATGVAEGHPRQLCGHHEEPCAAAGDGGAAAAAGESPAQRRSPLQFACMPTSVKQQNSTIGNPMYNAAHEGRGRSAASCFQPTLLSWCGACQGYLFTEAAHNRSFELIERSTFTLAPRGSGSGSFRMYEALQLGSIPIFIWGEHPRRRVAEWAEPWRSASLHSTPCDRARLKEFRAILHLLAYRLRPAAAVPGARGLERGAHPSLACSASERLQSCLNSLHLVAQLEILVSQMWLLQH